MTSTSQHVHIVDGKPVTYDTATCPLCHPEQYQKKATAEPQAYRKGDTIIIKVSKGVMVTTTYWKDKNVFLMDLQRMQRDTGGKVILGTDKMPLWAKMTVRLSPTVLQQYVYELSKLLSEVTASSSIPQRA